MRHLNRKSDKEIKEKIIKVFIENKGKNISSQRVTSLIGGDTNWSTIRNKLEELVNIGLLNKVIIDERVLGFSLNKEPVKVLREVLFGYINDKLPKEVKEIRKIMEDWTGEEDLEEDKA